MNQDKQEPRHRLDLIIEHLFNNKEATGVDIAKLLGSQRGDSAAVLRGDRVPGEKQLSGWASRTGVSAAWLKNGKPGLAPPWLADFDTLLKRLEVSVKASPPGFACCRDYPNSEHSQPLHMAIEVQAARQQKFASGERAFYDTVRELAISGHAMGLDKIDHEHPDPGQALTAFMDYGRSKSRIGTLGAADLVLLIVALSDAMGEDAEDQPVPMGTMGLWRLFLCEFERQTNAGGPGRAIDEQMHAVLSVYALLCDVARKAFASEG